jgi:hypothetical protein
MSDCPDHYRHLCDGPNGDRWRNHFASVSKMIERGPARTLARAHTTGLSRAAVVVATRTMGGQSHRGLSVNAAHTAAVLGRLKIPAVAIEGHTLADVAKAIEAAPFCRVLCVQALWYDPADLIALADRFPSLRIAVRCHSQAAFLAIEGRGGDLIRLIDAHPRILVAPNHDRLAGPLAELFGPGVGCLPNLYDVDEARPDRASRDDGPIRIGSFGANRVGKHHSAAALASILAARRLGMDAEFHCNAGRDESAVWGFTRSLCERAGVPFVAHPWADWREFRDTVGTMDVCVQLSATETFNVVTADAAWWGIPSVVGEAIEWGPALARAPIDDPDHAADVIVRTYQSRGTMGRAWRERLEAIQEAARASWLARLAAWGVEPERPPPLGVGDHFHAAATAWGLKALPGCGCEDSRREMNALGPDGCEANRERLVATVVQRARDGKFDATEAPPGVRAMLAAGVWLGGLSVDVLSPAVGRLLDSAIAAVRSAPASRSTM